MCPTRNAATPPRKILSPIDFKTCRRFKQTSPTSPKIRPAIINLSYNEYPVLAEHHMPRATKKADARPFKTTASFQFFLHSQ